MNEVLVAQNLTKTYMQNILQPDLTVKSQKKFAADDLSISLHKAEILGLVGPEGAGKTTLLRMFATLVKPESGAITAGGLDVAKYPLKFRRRIGYMNGRIDPEQLQTPNQLLNYFAKLYGIDREIAEGRKDRLLEELQIAKFACFPFQRLTASVKQKFALALCLLHNPDILLLDNPTQGMDILDTRLVANFLLDLKNANKSIIIVSDDLSLIKLICDRTAILIDGKLMHIADGEEHLENKFFELYNDTKGAMTNG